jgi:hypothetical protein
MHRSGIAIAFAVLFACSLPACTGNDTGARSQPTAAAAPPFARVEITPIAPTPHTPVWRSIEVRGETKERILFVDLEAGVLGKGSTTTGFYQIVDGHLDPIDFVTKYDGDVMGIWPDDAWAIEMRFNEVLASIRLLHIREGKSWGPEPYHGAERLTDAILQFRKSTRAQGGLLVTKDGVTERLAGSGPPPVVGSYRGELVDYIEAREGKVYVISKEDETFHVVVDCADEACVREKSRSLPLIDWTFSRHVTRDAESVSMLAKAGRRRFVLDVGPAGWALSEFPEDSRPEAMWASEDGGLWVVGRRDVLWHRDPSGTWRTLGLPAGIFGITAAMTADRTELWISGNSDSDPVVFATPAAPSG